MELGETDVKNTMIFLLSKLSELDAMYHKHLQFHVHNLLEVVKACKMQENWLINRLTSP